jgi:BTB/POZ domain-containing protein 9
MLKSEPKVELISKIRLPLMQMNELLNEVRGSSLVNADSILDAIKLKHESKDHELRYRGVLCKSQMVKVWRAKKVHHADFIVDPNENIATNRHNASVVKGEFKLALLDGDVHNYDFDRGFTSVSI